MRGDPIIFPSFSIFAGATLPAMVDPFALQSLLIAYIVNGSYSPSWFSASIPLRDTIRREYVFLIAIGWCKGMAELTTALGLSHEIGAFIASVALAAVVGSAQQSGLIGQKLAYSFSGLRY